MTSSEKFSLKWNDFQESIIMIMMLNIILPPQWWQQLANHPKYPSMGEMLKIWRQLYGQWYLRTGHCWYAQFVAKLKTSHWTGQKPPYEQSCGEPSCWGGNLWLFKMWENFRRRSGAERSGEKLLWKSFFRPENFQISGCVKKMTSVKT